MSHGDRQNAVRFAAAGFALALCAVALGACGADEDTPVPAGSAHDVQAVAITIDAKTCTPRRLSLNAGPVTFNVTNRSSSDRNEYEVLKGAVALGEQERIASGDTKSFTLTLAAGAYGTKCFTESASVKTADAITVTGAGGAATTPATASTAATERYRTYLEEQTTLLEERTEAFVDAVVDADLNEARGLYAPARIPYERIEPVAEAFGDLDPLIDIRINDVGGDVKFTGFHRLERAIFKDRSLKGMTPVAQALEADVERLVKLVRAVKLRPEQIANGATELLGEVSKSKITGEEERYSRIDLVDFLANVQGAQEAYRAVQDILEVKDPALNQAIVGEFAKVSDALKPYRKGDGFVPYTDLTTADTTMLSRAIDALAEPLSQVAAKVVGLPR